MDDLKKSEVGTFSDELQALIDYGHDCCARIDDRIHECCERIVRCRDCRYYDEIIHACDHPCVTPLRGDCPENWIFSCFDNDFCCWGERKEVGA